MDRIYNIEDAIKKAKKSVKYYEVRIQAWENVKRVKTKTGADFKILSKNFINCTFCADIFGNKIRVYFRDEEGASCYDDIGLYKNCYQDEKNTAVQVEAAINELIEKYKNWLETDKKGLENIEKQLQAIRPQLDELKKAIEDAKKTNTHYIMQSYIKNYLYILND